jgi:hypothetical protein
MPKNKTTTLSSKTDFLNNETPKKIEFKVYNIIKGYICMTNSNGDGLRLFIGEDYKDTKIGDTVFL